MYALLVFVLVSERLLLQVWAVQEVRCIESGRFYRNPDRSNPKQSVDECAKYFLCLEGEVFAFRCSTGLLFDIQRQICDFNFNVNNCEITTKETIPKPLLKEAKCPKNQLGCADGTCLLDDYFCDGSNDCPDGSDESYCDTNDFKAAKSCSSTCELPACFCSKDGTRIPGNVDPNQTPQMILLTFDDAVNADNWEIFKAIFTSERRNPNNCPIRATFFISHQFNNYQQTQKLWNHGHEIAVHSITHRGPENWWSYNATIEDWFDEMVGQANILHQFSSIRLSEIRGMRVPFLRAGWNRQFLMMKEFGFNYDSSMVAPFSNPPLWPYTLDHKMPHKCIGSKQNCPSRSYPGLWEMVINQLEADDYTCGMVDTCPTTLSGEDIYKMLIYNFKRHYSTNKAPFGLHFHSTWFKNYDYLIAFQKFIDEVLKQPDVWFVTNWQAIKWMQTPLPISKLYNFNEWSCKKQFYANELACNLPNICRLYSKIFQQDKYLYTCSECPDQYPWIRNEFGFD